MNIFMEKKLYKTYKIKISYEGYATLVPKDHNLK